MNRLFFCLYICKVSILVIDNYDSFTYNLVHLLEACTSEKIDVVYNDRISVEQARQFNNIVLSPGPGLPSEAGNMPAIIKSLATTKKILGICLGWQGIAEHFGAKLQNLDTVCHGMATPITITTKDALFDNCPASFLVGRYHSWVVDNQTVPDDLIITAYDQNRNIMAGKHQTLNIRGLQFHPESILSEYGKEMISNWLRL